MKTTKEYRILHNNKFIAEGLRYGEYDYTTEENAMTFTDEDDMVKYVREEMKLNIANIQRHVTTVITSTDNEMYVNGSWQSANDIEQCNHCYKWFPKSQLNYARHGDSDIELLCDEHAEKLDVVILKGDVV